MSHYAKVENGIVVNVIVAEQDFIDELPDKQDWIQTSYNTQKNVHLGPDRKPDGGVALRGNYAGIGFTYDSVNDVFIPPTPFTSWVLNNSTWTWEPPFPAPTDGMYLWNETTLSWNKVDIK